MSITRSTFLLLLLSAVLLPGGTARADGGTPVDRVRAIALEALGLAGTASEAVVDPALRLAACPTPLQAVPTSARTVEVRCDASPGWRIYVPVRVRREADVVVLTKAVPVGEPITAGHVAVRRRDMAGAGGEGFASPEAVIGMNAVQELVPGEALTREHVSEGAPVKRGDPVVLVSRMGGIEVRMAGRALGRAAPGGTVAVENVASRRIIRGRLLGDGLVEVVN